ncbi:unnamed protein product [Mytilus edulis]|uniref:Ig-like domain-containing protein n=1 Tax=Mytilus edulis TaxID=6550 RepID=A0A8S3RJT7_MYTED|nr:unnamed protein product [Mytilus edulis]
MTNILLTCNVTDANPAVTFFTWKKDDSMISGTATYTIPIVKRSHAGSYTCSAANSVGVSDPSTALQLEVLYGVKLIIVSIKEPVEGTRLTVTCNGQSNPAITDNDVTWTKQNNITFIRKGRLLLVDNVNRLDSGTYVCSVVIELLPSISQPINVTGRTTVEVDVLCKYYITFAFGL